MKKRKKSVEDIVLDSVIYVILIALSLVCLLPVWHIIVASFSSTIDITSASGLMLWPKKIDLGAYKLVFNDASLIGGFKNTLLFMAGALPLNIVLTVMAGYFLSCNDMMWKKVIAGIILFTMYFNGGLIPNYLNFQDLNLIDTLWALVVGGAISVYNALICKASMEAVPASLKESAYLDGANDFQVLFKIILPLIKATLAVLTLYYGVSHWNSWFNAAVFIRTESKLPVQNILRSILIVNQDISGDADSFNLYAETIKYAAIVISTAPIMCIYPFLQKYFAKGTLVGAVKG